MRRVLGVVGLLLLWEGLAAWGLLNPLYAPPPHQVLLTLYGLFQSGEILPHLQATFTAALLGLFWGVLLGGSLGLLAAFSPLFADMLEPIMLLLNAIPRVILAPLFVIWLGIGLASKVALSLVLVSVLLFFAVYGGVRNVDPRLVERVETLGGGRLWLLKEVYLPSLAAWVLSSLKVAVGFAFTGAVVGEFVAASRGLGYLLSFAQSTYNAKLSLALITLIVLFVLLLFFLFDRLERHLLRWRPRGRAESQA
ncbi:MULTISPECIES: ABC transporter permease [Thermus]|uniref:ABC transporter permease n=1 Tax=Thermus scotoductus TaxID=37636 RepID=A0A430RFJ3_THESC|nr:MULTISPECIES: ABC transporter permease [Thermus]ETN87441.1 ABC transporter permease [Thermus sp. NMX2.A1]RTH06539.1 ABC transporter permease [Thermus scotoductus]